MSVVTGSLVLCEVWTTAACTGKKGLNWQSIFQLRINHKLKQLSISLSSKLISLYWHISRWTTIPISDNACLRKSFHKFNSYVCMHVSLDHRKCIHYWDSQSVFCAPSYFSMKMDVLTHSALLWLTAIMANLTHSLKGIKSIIRTYIRRQAIARFHKITRAQ